MFYSQKLKILIIGIPKTGSTTVENALIKFEPDGERHTITINDRLFTSDDFHQGILGHARAFEIKDVLGPDIYNSLYTIAFIRHPFSRLVSAYYFNKRNSLFEFLKIKSGKKSLFR
ncbi:MAG: sulfotransferase family 2 domain-containing protein, partial [Flavobacteriales bacterium]|nr:sulfotransferase family 2 domain-containing protein [Flavobacteriales bacterium]